MADMRVDDVHAAVISISIIPIANAAGGAGRCLPSLPSISSRPIGLGGSNQESGQPKDKTGP
jgi:hypothetical protein